MNDDLVTLRTLPSVLLGCLMSATLAAAAGQSTPSNTPTAQPTRPHANERAALAPRPVRATIKDIQRVVLPDAVRVTIELDAEVPFHEERLADPARVFLDLFSTDAAPALVDRTLRYDADDDVVRQVRVGRRPKNTTRVVLETAGVSSYSVYALYDPYRLVIDCARAAPRAAPAMQHDLPSPPLARRKFAANWTSQLPSGRPAATRLLAAVRASLQTEASAALPAPVSVDELPAHRPEPLAPATAMPAKNLGGGFSIARQLGLNVSRIVVDPGHGGHDPGAEGQGVSEAELVLDIALRLEAILKKTPGIDVILTRRTDDFVPLQERTAIANREGADLFLSIHANASSSPQARGIETYFLNFANSQRSAAVAARENSASGQAMGALPDMIKAIALNNKLDESRDFASQIQRAMLQKLRLANKALKDLGVKQAPFVVLIGAAMPSVLAEISFVTNPQEARLLRGSPYRQRIAEALSAAIRTYQTSLKGVTAYAHQ